MSIREEKAKEALQHVISKEKKMKFPELIRQIRKSLGMTRVFVSKQMGLKHSRVVSLESSKSTRAPTEYEVIRIANYYGVSLELLLKKCKFKRNNRRLNLI